MTDKRDSFQTVPTVVGGWPHIRSHRPGLESVEPPSRCPSLRLGSLGMAIAESRGLLGRDSEIEMLDRLLDTVRAGRSAVLVLRGEPGVGKSALLACLVERASGCRIARAAGVESEMELPFAGLHQLCAPMLDRLPAPQRDALATAFGLSAGEAPDRFLVGLAVLSLLSEVAEDRPLVCAVDDAQ